MIIVEIPFAGGRLDPLYDTYGGRHLFSKVAFDGGNLYAEYDDTHPDATGSPPIYAGTWPLDADVERRWRSIPTGIFYQRLGKAKYGQFANSANTDLQYLKVIIDAHGVVNAADDQIRQLLKALVTEGIATRNQLTAAFS